MESDEDEHKTLLHGNLGHRRYGSKVEHAYDNTSFSIDSNDLRESEHRQQNTSEVALTTDELLYQMRYAFVTPDFQPLVEIQKCQSGLHGSEKIQFKEKLLEGLKESSLTINEKLEIHKVIKQDYRSRHSERNAQRYIQSRSRQGYGQYLIFWESAISKLAAYFGSNVASYFTFLRTLFYLNLLMGILMFCLTSLPQIISGDLELIVPDNLYRNENAHFGYLSTSVMFYGAYSNEGLHMYNEPLAYLLAWIVIGLMTLIFIVVSMHIRYRRSKLSDKGDEYPFSWSLFCSWDHSIITKAGVRDHFSAIYTEMKERIIEEMSLEVITWLKRLCRYFGRIVSNIIVFAMLGGSGYLIYYVQEEFVLPDEAPEIFKDLFKKYQLAVVVSLLKILIPFLFTYLVKLEGLHPRTKLKMTIFRTMFFYFASLIVFILSLSNLAKCARNENIEEKNNTQTCVDNHNTTAEFCCWENGVGEEIFKVILIDLGLMIAVGLITDVVRAAFVKYRVSPCNIGYSEFKVTAKVLDLVYGQGLIWLGFYFSPILPLIGSIKLIIVFYFRYNVARIANVPPKKLFKASRSGSFYFFLLLLTWILCTAPVAYFLIALTPSWHCGPFRCEDKVYDVIAIDVNLPSWLDWLKTLWEYMGTAIVIIPVIIVLLLLILYYRARVSSYSDLVRELRNMLAFERKVEKRKVFARALKAPAGSLGKASGATTMTQIDNEGRSNQKSDILL